jgi:hypothetical protein
MDWSHVRGCCQSLMQTQNGWKIRNWKQSRIDHTLRRWNIAASINILP